MEQAHVSAAGLATHGHQKISSAAKLFCSFTKTTNSNHRQFDCSSPTQLATPNVVEITTPLFKTVITRVPHGGFHDAVTT